MWANKTNTDILKYMNKFVFVFRVVSSLIMIPVISNEIAMYFKEKKQG